MSRLSPHLLITGLVVLFLAFAAPFPLFASQGIPQIELSVSQASPGATIEVAGGRFEPDALVTLIMFRPERQIQLGTVLADDHGEFISALLLPIDLPYGQYEFRAVDEHNRMATAVLTISRDTGGQEESSQRGEDEPLLAPMPEHSARATSANSAGSVNATPSSTETRPTISPTLLLASGLALVMFIAGLVVVLRRSR